MSVEVITTGDGSQSLLNTELNETYHSVHGALRESLHVFIQHGLTDYRVSHPEIDELRILEVGFGTGLNAWLVENEVIQHSQRISYTSFETFPLPPSIWEQLKFTDDVVGLKRFHELHRAPWNVDIELVPGFTLKKVQASIINTSFSTTHFDIVFFDAFAPNKQPEMWTLDVLANVVASLKPGGIFVTYCAKGQLKRDLKSLGLMVETLPGPPGKKEMVRATRSAL